MTEELYTIGEVAQLTGVPVKTIRYYDQIGLLPPATTTAARYRLYSAAEIWRLELVRTLRHVGFGLVEVRRILSGHIDTATAIAWQIEVLEEQIGHLTQLRDLLRQAHTAMPQGECTLTFLHDIGAAVTRGAEERGRFLAAKLGSALGMPSTWTERLIEEAPQHLPAEPTADQAAAWAELTALLNEPEFVAATRAHAAPFWETMRQQQVDTDWWHATMAEIGTRAQAALETSVAADSPAARRLARDWAALFAQMLGQPCDDAFLLRFAAQAPQFVDARARRVIELLERAGWYGAAPSQLQVQQLLLDGLRALVQDAGE